MLFFEEGGENTALSPEDLRRGLATALAAMGPRRRVLAVPPDYTRSHSLAGELTRMCWEHYGERGQRSS